MSLTARSTSLGGGIPPGLAIWSEQNNEGAPDCRGNGAGLYVGTIYGAAGDAVEPGQRLVRRLYDHL